MENTRLIIKFSGYHENGYETAKIFTILNIKGDVSMEAVTDELVKTGKLSPFRRRKEINIYYMQAF